MGKVNKCIYKVVDPKLCSVYEASEYFFNQNVAGITSQFNSEYEDYELKQMMIRGKMVREFMDENPNEGHPNLNSVIFGASTTKNRVVLIADL